MPRLVPAKHEMRMGKSAVRPSPRWRLSQSEIAFASEAVAGGYGGGVGEAVGGA